jgi:hypothetical protein
MHNIMRVRTLDRKKENKKNRRKEVEGRNVKGERKKERKKERSKGVKY